MTFSEEEAQRRARDWQHFSKYFLGSQLQTYEVATLHQKMQSTFPNYATVISTNADENDMDNRVLCQWAM